ncbi:MAG: GNAT family N-acetyltransferase [Promethearchaeota archaeon]
MNVIIKPLSPDLLDDFLNYFDNIAFSDNPGWSKCYCHFYHFNGTNQEFAKRTAEENRNASKDLILSGKMNGFIAYLDNKPVGWCNVNLKENFAKIPFKYKGDTLDSNKKIASIICFIIAPKHRKQGIARKLLKFAISYMKNNDYDLIEVYPSKGKNLSDAHSYRGPISLYISEGFYTYKKYKNHDIMRRKL